MMLRTKGAKETKKFAARFAKNILPIIQNRLLAGTVVVSLEGALGAGKTTFAQGFAKALGIKEKISSPTFVVMKKYDFRIPGSIGYKLSAISCVLYHIDCYRLERPEELLALGFEDLLQDSMAIVLIEWGDRVKRMLPASRITLKFSHGGKNIRRVDIRGFDGILGTESNLDSRLRGNDEKQRRCYYT